MNIALIAHDKKKDDLIVLVKAYAHVLQKPLFSIRSAGRGPRNRRRRRPRRDGHDYFLPRPVDGPATRARCERLDASLRRVFHPVGDEYGGQ